MATIKRLWLTYLVGFLLAAHFALISYVNSSLLGQFVDIRVLNVLYVVGSIFDILLLTAAPYMLRRYGHVYAFAIFISLETLVILGMGLFSTPLAIIPLFIMQLAFGSILYFWLDLCLEQETAAENTTGNKRGGLLTFSNMAWVMSPIAVAFLANQNNFSRVYFLAGLVLVVMLLIIIMFFKNKKKTDAASAKIFSGFKLLWKEKDMLRIAVVQFVLNFFYAWMVIYMPLLLNKEMGFGWDKIGIIFTFMLLPFLIFQWPAGYLADKKTGEKEILAVGFSVMALATFIVPFISAPVFWIWAAVLFATRVGASLVEVGSESYFFKHVREEDASQISVFRMVRSFSYVLAPIVALPVVYFFSYSTSFLFLAFFTLLGLFFIPKIDTR